MKKTNKKMIKIITIILAIVLISMISFFGIYTQNKNQVNNKVKDYQYAMALNGTRTIKLKVNTDNSEDVLNAENYKKVKTVIEKRLKKLDVQEYNIMVNEENGEITIEIPENTSTDEVVSNLTTVGKFEVIDNDTQELLLNNDNIKSSDVLYNTTSSGTTIYLEITFDKEGKEKLEEITRTYVAQENNTTTNTTTNITTNTVANETTNETANDTTNETTNETEKSTKTEKKIAMKIDDETILTTSFDEPITTGKIQLSVGKASTSSETIKENTKQARNLATILSSGNMTVKYDLEKNQYILSDISHDVIVRIEITVAIIAIIGIIGLIIKYKKLGLLAGISYIGLAATYLLLVRYTNVLISMESISGIIIVLILNYLFTNNLLKNINKNQNEENTMKKATKETYIEFLTKSLPIFIMVIAFCFVKWVPISSFGMIAFWGIVLIVAYNAIVTRTLLKIEKE